MPKKKVKKDKSRQTTLDTKPKLLSKEEIKRFKAKRHPIEMILVSIIILSIIGLAVAGYLIYMHYRPEAASICSFNNKLDCDVVNKSVYSEFLGIPNSIIGSLGYLYFILVSVIILRGYDLSRIHHRLKAKHLNFLVILFAAIGWLFSMYLLYVEKYILNAYCIFCLASLAIISIIFILAIISYSHCIRCRNLMNRIHYKARGRMCRHCG